MTCAYVCRVKVGRECPSLPATVGRRHLRPTSPWRRNGGDDGVGCASSPRSFRRAMNREVTSTGAQAVRCSPARDDQRYASASSEVPTGAMRRRPLPEEPQGRRVVAESRAIFRMWPVLVERISTRPGRSETDRRTSSTPFSKSTSDHRNPQFAAATAGRGRDEEQGRQAGILLLCSLDEELDLLRRRSIRFVALHGRRRCLRRGERSRRPHSTPWFRAAEHTAWYRRTLVAEGPSGSAGRRRRRGPTPSASGDPSFQFLGDGGSHAAVLDQGLRRPSSGLDVVEPTIEKASESLVGQRDPSVDASFTSRAASVWASRRPPCTVVVRIPVAVRRRVTPEGHPHLPNAGRAFT